MTDQDLWQQFLTGRSEAAFAELVRRYIGLVYAAARRQIKDPGAAEDVTQSVFVLLARRARTLRNAAAIPGWLLVTTRSVALNAIRAQIRRERHESKAAVMKQESQSQVPAAWGSIGPLLDEAVATLRADDRDALMLRYFQNQPLVDVANALGISEPAARKRVQRAVERLRRFFASRGIVTSAEALGAMLPAHVLAPTPTAALCAQIAHTAISSTQTIAGGTLPGALKGAVLLMTASKTNVAIACAVVALAAGISGTVAYLATQTEQPIVASAPATMPASVSQPAEDWRDRFKILYSLNPGETIKLVSAPFPPERSEYSNVEKLAGQVEGELRHPDMIVFEADGPVLKRMGIVFGAQTLRNVLSPVAGLLPAQTNLSPEMLDTPVVGDWIIRKGATQAERIDGISTQLAYIFGPGMTLKPSQVERETIIVRGTFKSAAPTSPDAPARAPTISIARAASEFSDADGGYRGKASDMMMSLGECLEMPVVLEGNYRDQVVNWSIEPSADFRATNTPPNPNVVDEILATVSKQTSLQLKREKRSTTIWQLEPK